MANKNLTLKAAVSLEVKKALSGLGKLQTGIANLGKSLATAFSVASIAMFGRQIVNVGKDFEDAMARVKAVSNATVGEFNTLTQAARKMGETTKYTATEAAEALEKLTRNGMKAVEAAQALPSVLKFAQANAIELAQAADILKISLNMFDLSATNSARVADVLSTTAANTASDVLELHDALVNVAPAAKVLGFSIEEVASAIGALAQRGVKGAAAGTQLRIGLIKMVDPKIIKKMQGFGVNIDENTMKAKGLYETIKKFSDQNISLEQLTEIFSQKGAVGVQQLVNSLEDMRYMMAQIENQSKGIGTTERMFRDGIGSVKRELDTLKSKWESTLISMSTGSKPVFTGIIRLFQNFTDLLRNSLWEAMLVITSIAFPALVKGFKAIKTAIKEVNLASFTNLWIALAQAILLVSTAIWGRFQRINKPIKEAKENLAALDVQAIKDKESIERLGEQISNTTKDDFNGFIAKLDQLKSLFPDLADAIEDAGKRAYKNGQWEEFKETLEEIYDLQHRMSSLSRRGDLYNAQRGALVSTVKGGVNSFQANSVVNWVGTEFKSYLRSNYEYGTQTIENIFDILMDKMLKAKDASEAFSQTLDLFDEFQYRDWMNAKRIKTFNLPYGSKFEDYIKLWIKDIMETKQFQAARNTLLEMDKMSASIYDDQFKILKENFEEKLKDFNQDDLTLIYPIADKYIKDLSSLGQKAGKAGLDAFSKSMEAEVKALREKYIIPLEDIASTWRNTESPLGKKMADYVDSEKALWAQTENGVLTNEEYNKKLRELRAETFETIAKFDDLDGQLALLGKDAIKLKNTLLLAWTELKAITEGEEVASSEEKTKSDLKSFRSKYPQFKERDKSRDWRLTDKQIAEEDLRHLENYHDALVSFLASIDEEELKEKGIFDEVKQEIEDLKAKLEWAKKNIDDKDILIDYIEQLEVVDDIIKDIEAHTMSIKDLTMQSIRNYGKQIEQVGSHTLSIAQNIDKLRELNGLEPIFNDESIQKLQAYANILKDLVGIYDAIKKAMEVTAAIDDYRSAQKFKNTLQNIAATQAETAAEKAQAAEAMKVAVAEGAGSVAKTPWIGPALAVIAAAAISSAIISNSKKNFASGGIVPGTSYSGDKVVAGLNSGEIVMNKAQQQHLWNFLNGQNSGVGGGEVQFRISGKDLIGTLRNNKLLTTGKL
jgi:TP901 family phage tail tape measure protein